MRDQSEIGSSEIEENEDVKSNEDIQLEDGPEILLSDSEFIIESTMEEKRSAFTTVLLLGLIVFFAAAAVWVLQNPKSISLALIPTATSIAPTRTMTPTWTPLPTETLIPESTATVTPVPAPSDTPQTPRLHQVVPGETLFNLSLRYGVTLDSIAEANEIPSNSGLQVSQQVIIPWPTATPPLARVAVEVGGETIVADPAECSMYEIKGGDTFFGISARERVPLEALMAVNRLTEQSILQPGDSICIPKIIRGGVLPPTPGPSPSATATEPPPGPQLLFPVREANIDPSAESLFLQWVAVKELADDEWYMVEVTDLTTVDSYPNRAFTRQTSFQIPSSWRSIIPEMHQYRWRIQIVHVTGERQDGSFTYTFGGNRSEDAYFNWVGAAPTVTPSPTHTPTLEPDP
jgi:LysM repeat protein